jgi:hypothetical protein
MTTTEPYRDAIYIDHDGYKVRAVYPKVAPEYLEQFAIDVKPGQEVAVTKTDGRGGVIWFRGIVKDVAPKTITVSIPEAHRNAGTDSIIFSIKKHNPKGRGEAFTAHPQMNLNVFSAFGRFYPMYPYIKSLVEQGEEERGYTYAE